MNSSSETDIRIILTVFASLGLTGQSTSLFTTGLFGVVKTTFMFVWLLFLIDHFGRRPYVLHFHLPQLLTASYSDFLLSARSVALSLTLSLVATLASPTQLRMVLHRHLPWVFSVSTLIWCPFVTTERSACSYFLLLCLHRVLHHFLGGYPVGCWFRVVPNRGPQLQSNVYRLFQLVLGKCLDYFFLDHL